MAGETLSLEPPKFDLINQLRSELARQAEQDKTRVEAIKQSMALMREKIAQADRQSDLQPLCEELVVYLQRIHSVINACEPAVRTRLLADVWYTVIQAQDAGVFKQWIHTTFVAGREKQDRNEQWRGLESIADQFFDVQTGRKVRVSATDHIEKQQLQDTMLRSQLELGMLSKADDAQRLLSLMTLSWAQAQHVRFETEGVGKPPTQEKKALFGRICRDSAHHADQLLQFLSSMQGATTVNGSQPEAPHPQLQQITDNIKATERTRNQVRVTPDRIKPLADKFTVQINMGNGQQVFINLLDEGFKSIRHGNNNEVIYTVTDHQGVTRELICPTAGYARLLELQQVARTEAARRPRIEQHPVRRLDGLQLNLPSDGDGTPPVVPIAQEPTNAVVPDSTVNSKTVPLGYGRQRVAVPENGPLQSVDIFKGLTGAENLQRSKVTMVDSVNVVGSTTNPSPDRLTIAIGAGPRDEKKAVLGNKDRNKVKKLKSPEGVVVTGGQDAVGVAKFVYAPHVIAERLKHNQVVIHSLAAEADGTSYGADESATADMAEELVNTVVGSAATLVKQGINKDGLRAQLEATLRTVHDKMRAMKNDKGNFKTAAAATVSVIMTALNERNEECVYLENLYVGDTNCLILAEGANGLEVFKLLDPADGLAAEIKKVGVDLNALSVAERHQTRAQKLVEMGARLSSNALAGYEQAKQIYTGPGIIHAIGEDENRYVLREQRLNLSEEFKEHKRLWVLPCSDYLGDKLSVQDIHNVFNAAINYKQSFPVLLAQLMEQRRDDDSSFVLHEVKLR